MTALDWQQTGEYGGRPVYEAKYVAFETPAGPAVATFTVRAYYGSRNFAEYKAMLYDPYVDSLGLDAYIAYCKGNEMEGSWEESLAAAQAVCEGFGVDQTGNSPFNCAWEYGHYLYEEKTFKRIAEQWCIENEGEFMDEWLGSTYHSSNGTVEMDFYVLEGGYERVRTKLYMNENFEFSSYAS